MKNEIAQRVDSSQVRRFWVGLALGTKEIEDTKRELQELKSRVSRPHSMSRDLSGT